MLLKRWRMSCKRFSDGDSALSLTRMARFARAKVLPSARANGTGPLLGDRVGVERIHTIGGKQKLMWFLWWNNRLSSQSHLRGHSENPSRDAKREWNNVVMSLPGGSRNRMQWLGFWFMFDMHSEEREMLNHFTGNFVHRHDKLSSVTVKMLREMCCCYTVDSFMKAMNVIWIWWLIAMSDRINKAHTDSEVIFSRKFFVAWCEHLYAFIRRPVQGHSGNVWNSVLLL